MILSNARYEQFCQFIVAGHSQTQAAKLAGFPPSAAHNAGSRLMKRDEIRSRIAELRDVGKQHSEAPVAAATILQGIRTNGARVAGYEARRDQLLTIIQERANDPEMLNVAGGRTGLLVRVVKRGGGDEYRLDREILDALLKLEERAAEELGQNKPVASHLIDARSLNIYQLSSGELLEVLAECAAKLPAHELRAVLAEAPELAEMLPVVVNIEAQQVCGNRPAEEPHESEQSNGSLDTETACE
jgi:hypothetical protein